MNNQIVSYYSSTQTIYVDKTAPTYNITRLASLSANSAMLSAINGKAYTSDYYKDSNGTYYYANVSNFDFAIDSTFAFTRPTISSGAVDTQEGTQLYFRKYNKYDEDSYATTNKNQAYQAIVPGDTEYISGTSAKLRFSTQNTTLWKSFVYNTSFVEQLKREYNTTNMASLYGYYEIVEIDAVGNHSIYTVLFNEKSPTFTFNYNASNGANEAIYPNASAQNPNAISSYNSIELISINSVDDWYRITVDNYLNLIVTPSGDINEVISAINAALDRGKNIYLLTISNRFGNDVTVSVIINFSAETFSVTSSNTHDNEGYYTVYFEEDKDGLIMSKVRVQKFNSDTKTFVDMVNNSNQAIDSAEQVINVTEKRYYLFTEGIYKFFIEDNFNYGANATVVTLNVGNSGTNYSLTFDGGKINYQGKIYTTQNVTLVASPERYTISATRNGSSIDVTTENFVFSAPNEGIEANVSSGGEYKYVVSILDNVTGESIVEEFIIYNFFPAVNATNSKGENMDKLLATNKSSVSSFTSDSVYLTYSANGYTFGYSFILRKYDNLSSTAYTIVNTGANGTTVYAKAAYELVITNTTLNSTRSVWFVIRESTISMYSVVERLPNGTLNELTPSQTLLDITGYRTQIKTYLSNKGKEYNFGSTLSVKNYFTIYDFEVTVDGDKGLTTNWGIEGDSIVYTSTTGGMSNSTYIVVVYGSSPYNYLDIFALTKVSSNSRFLESISYSYETTQTLEDGTKTTETVNVTVDSSQFDNVSVYENPITVSWASYYYINLNKVYMTYSYNGKTIGTISPSNLATTSIVFNDDGEYKLWFNDLAGNKMLFGETSSNEFTITIKSIVKTLVNDDLPIYGAVYNGEVNFEIYEPGDYTQLSADVYINGIFQKDIKISKNSAKATFTTVGFYKIIVSGSIRTSTSAVKALSNNEIVFTIINPNESKFAYEFASISGYEITSVKKNGFDITDDIRGNNAGIYSLVLSEDINGIGKYSVTIHADFVNSLRESEDFTFDVWINNKTPSLDCNTRRNETSVNTIVITYNPKALYEQLGSCKIVIGAQEFEINENAMKEEGNKTLSIDVAGTYYITLVTESGNIISIYKVTKQDPLNTLSIILIVLGVGLAIGAGYLFYRLRIKMKIK